MKRLKMCLYGEPGVGKSVFASQAPKPFFITTDGNYEWLEEFGAKEEDHIQVNSWAEAKKVFQMNFDKYETIVVDLTEDLFKWCEHEYCLKNKLEHVSDVGYGKGYDATRNEFFLEMCKLIGLDKHIIFIMHGLTFTVKDRRGVEHTKYGPTNRLPDKVLDMIEGRVRYFLRCYVKAEESEDKQLIKKRYLSLIPKENEFGICRGIDENKVPHDIPLDFKTFANIIGIDTISSKIENKENQIKVNKIEIIEEETKENIENETQNDTSMTQTIENNINTKEEIKESIEVKSEPQKEQIKQEKTNDEKLDAIRAKLARLKEEE